MNGDEIEDRYFACVNPQGYAAVLCSAARWRPDARALIIGDECRTYAQLLARGTERARELKVLGFKFGDRLGILMPNSVAFVEVLIGAAILGVIAVPMNTRFKSAETAHLVADARMTAIYTTDRIENVVDFRDLLEASLPGLGAQTDPFNLKLEGFPELRSIVMLGQSRPGFLDEQSLHERAVAYALPNVENAPPADAPLLLLYTSGTTANPKGCIISSRALIGTALSLADRYGITTNDVWWCPLPMFHMGGLLFMSLMFTRAGFYVGMKHPDPDEAFDLVEKFKPTIFYSLFPPITLGVMDHPRFSQTNFDSVRYVFSVATADVQRKIQAAFPAAILCSAFGLTETCGAVTFSLPDDSFEDRIGTCGPALPGWDVRVVDPDTRETVSIGAHGEIEAKGIGLFDGYLNDPQLTAKQFTTDGYFKTGDIGSLDDNRRLRFHGRFKDQLKVGGENVSALEVESFLSSHPAVKQAQVVGVPDDRFGEVPAAFIELMSEAELTESELIDYCNGRIARFKIPRHVRIVDEWPMSATKIMKNKLRERIAEELALKFRPT